MKNVTTEQLTNLLRLIWEQFPASRSSKPSKIGDSIWPHFYEAIAFVNSYYQLFPEAQKLDPIYGMLREMTGMTSENIAALLCDLLLTIGIVPPGEWKFQDLFKGVRTCP